MKREILCLNCTETTKRTLERLPETPGEHHKFIAGKARHYFRCDGCHGRVFEGQACSALSIWSDNSPAPYYQWEGEYLNANSDRNPKGEVP